MDRYFFILTTIDLFVLGFMCLLTRLSESLNKKQKRGFLLAFALIACISVLEVITIVVDGAPPGYRWLNILLAAVAVSVFLSDRKVLGQVDYCLIFTFIAFFIFTGNIGRLPAFQEVLHSLVNGRELLVGIATSQVISNVPAALLLSGFSGDLKQLLLGVNLGGLGTLIASMASLISYKIYAHNYNRTKGYYLLWFHLANIIFLAVLVLLALGMR